MHDQCPLEADLAQAQLRALQMQLQPHFLFNTLHGIAMLTDTDPAQAAMVAERLRTSLAGTPIETEKGPIQATASIGLSWTANGNLEINQLLSRADEAVYKAKASGRNRVVVADQVSPIGDV